MLHLCSFHATFTSTGASWSLTGINGCRSWWCHPNLTPDKADYIRKNKEHHVRCHLVGRSEWRRHPWVLSCGNNTPTPDTGSTGCFQHELSGIQSMNSHKICPQPSPRRPVKLCKIKSKCSNSLQDTCIFGWNLFEQKWHTNEPRTPSTARKLAMSCRSSPCNVPRLACHEVAQSSQVANSSKKKKHFIHLHPLPLGLTWGTSTFMIAW